MDLFPGLTWIKVCELCHSEKMVLNSLDSKEIDSSMNADDPFGTDISKEMSLQGSPILKSLRESVGDIAQAEVRTNCSGVQRP
jgi:hypothetical protein